MIPQITSDFLHKYLLKTILPLALSDRFVVNGRWSGKGTVCISFDCDVEDDMKRIPLLLNLLNDMSVSCSFALIGKLAQDHPSTVREIIGKGQEVINHTFSHPEDFRSMGYETMKREVESFQRLMIDEFHYKPKGFRAPHLMRKYDRGLFDILRENELYDTSYIGRGAEMIDGLIELPLSSCPEHPQVCFDYWHHFHYPIAKCSVKKFLNLWSTLFERERFVNVYLDPHLISNEFLRELIRRVPDDFSYFCVKDIACLVNTHDRESFV